MRQLTTPKSPSITPAWPQSSHKLRFIQFIQQTGGDCIPFPDGLLKETSRRIYIHPQHKAPPRREGPCMKSSPSNRCPRSLSRSPPWRGVFGTTQGVLGNLIISTLIWVKNQTHYDKKCDCLIDSRYFRRVWKTKTQNMARINAWGTSTSRKSKLSVSSQSSPPPDLCLCFVSLIPVEKPSRMLLSVTVGTRGVNIAGLLCLSFVIGCYWTLQTHSYCSGRHTPVQNAYGPCGYCK